MNFNATRLLPLLALSALGLQSMPSAPASLPPLETGAKAQLDKSPRHGEWVDVTVEGSKTPLKCWVVYPETKDKAPVVIVIHEIFGESDWIRSVTDSLAAEGFIAVAPDLLSGVGPNGGGTDSLGGRDAVTKAIRDVKPDTVMKDLDAVSEWAKKLPATNGKIGTAGFCWGGGMSFQYAIHSPTLGAAVVYYGTNPSDPAQIEKIKAPVLGLYGKDDARVTSTVAPCDELMKKAGKPYTHFEYEGAGHGFLRQQDGRGGANLKAAQQGWRETIKFLTEKLAPERATSR